MAIYLLSESHRLFTYKPKYVVNQAIITGEEFRELPDSIRSDSTKFKYIKEEKRAMFPYSERKVYLDYYVRDLSNEIKWVLISIYCMLLINGKWSKDEKFWLYTGALEIFWYCLNDLIWWPLTFKTVDTYNWTCLTFAILILANRIYIFKKRKRFI